MNPFAAYLQLVRRDHRQVLAEHFDQATCSEATSALLKSGLLSEGPAATRYPCLGAGPSCPRRVIAYQGPHLDLYCARAVPPEQHFCCPPVNLSAEQVRTYVADERLLATQVNEWLGAESGLETDVDDGAPMWRIGYLFKGAPIRVFLARRLTSRAARDRLRELEDAGDALVIALQREDGLPPDIEERYSGRLGVRLLFLEDLLQLEGENLRFASIDLPPWEPRTMAVEQPLAGPRVLDLAGERAASEAEVSRLRAEGSLHLFVDMSVSARGGGAAGYATMTDANGASVRQDFVLTMIQAKILLEYVRAAGRPIAPQRLACVRAAGIRDAARRVRELRARMDECHGRDHYRAFQSHKSSAGLVSEFSFSPPADFRMAIILPARA